ncbi:MAG: hypothetical protein R3F30_07740 [Planctomycetota bacterium]
MACVSVLLAASALPAQKASYELFGKGCEDTSFTVKGLPVLGQTYTLVLGKTSTPPAQPLAILALGGSNTSWGPFPLPIDLAPLGAKGCMLLVSVDMTFAPYPTTPTGLELPIKLPADKRLAGITFFQQFFVLSPHNNWFRFSTTNGGKGVTGVTG